MSILATFMVPHPPLIIPTVGRGNERGIQATINAYEEVADRIAALQPDTIIITSPHTILYLDYFHISPGAGAQGDFGQFGAAQTKISCTYDTAFVAAVSKAAQGKLPAGTMGERNPRLDHATMIPLYFVQKKYQNFKTVRVGLSGESLKEHYQLGQLLTHIADQLQRRIVVIASGDLSHKLKDSGPYGYDPAGPQYDQRLMQAMQSANFGELFNFDETFCEQAAECGHRSFTIMAGTLDGIAVRAQQLSYEGPFGVGYGVCAFTPLGPDPARHFLEHYDQLQQEKQAQRLAKEDAYVRLARASLEAFISRGERLPLPQDLPAEMLNRRAGAFVSLKKHGQLRGCIGTIGPVTQNIATEIMRNAISAASEDPRFAPVRPDELDQLVYSVDVLGPLEDIASPSQLEVKRYGVIVTKGGRRGLLLPNLEGVNTVDEQLQIAKQKAGLSPKEEGVALQRFEVVRHY